MSVLSHNLYFIHETEKSKNTSSPAAVWVTCPWGLLPPNSLSASAFPSLWWLSERFGAGAFNRVQVIRGFGYTCEQKAMWKMCLRFHLLLQLNATVRWIVTSCTFCWGFGVVRWAVASNQLTQLCSHSNHAFSVLFIIPCLPLTMFFFRNGLLICFITI